MNKTGFPYFDATTTFPQFINRWRLVSDIVNGIIKRQEADSRQNTTVVKKISDFGTISEKKVRPDPARLYMIDGVIDTEGVSIVVDGTSSISALNGGRDIFGLRCMKDNYTMFINPPGGVAGNLFLTSISIFSSGGANSKVFDLDNNSTGGAIEFRDVNFGGFSPDDGITELGNLSGYRQYFYDTMGFYNVDEGWTYGGTSSGLVMTNANVISFPAGATLLKAAPGLLFTGSVRSNCNFRSVNAASIFCDFSAANIQADGGLLLESFRTTATNPLPNILASDVKAQFDKCQEIENTYPGGRCAFTVEAATNPGAVNTPTKLAGTTTATRLAWFEQSANNRIGSITSQPLQMEVSGIFSVSGGNNDQVEIWFRHYNSAGTLLDEGMKVRMTLNGGTIGNRAEAMPVDATFEMNDGDYVEAWGQNVSDASSFTVMADSRYTLKAL